MGSGIYIAAAGAVAQSNALDVTAANVANASTTGYQGSQVVFSEVLSRTRSPDTTMVTAGTATLVADPGPITDTENPLDIALDGPGYFAVDGPAGVRWTRAGALTTDAGGRLVTADGLPVRGKGGTPLVIPGDAEQITIDEAGAISTERGPVGQLELAQFAPAALAKEGATLYVATGQPLAAPPPTVVQNALEGSNVNVVRGVVELVQVSRTYEALLRVIEGFKAIEGRAARDLGGPR